MRHPKAVLTATVSLGLCATALNGCTGADERPAQSPAVSGTPAAASTARDCAVTGPSDRTAEPPAEVPRDGTDRWYGEEVLWVSLPDPSYHPEKGPDGHSMKVGWWRLTEGPLTVRATRVGGGKATMTPHIPSGYGRTGFQASGLDFSETGCWRVTATLADTDIDFHLRVQ
ncbi:hypothetical protein GCM10009677_01400 [Sphaerisporangium rubeum]|uniref:Uncharacterized protein n=1 Tax=Sphaerisporangium rubeum TaxID=321317 RepID=A0A7X0ID71_9ACTN|nr:hypothetical protein [Sphaerisporangium rubeum]MBB6473092.1 hypothetical protein [Sphaerisporangium rubeum]